MLIVSPPLCPVHPQPLGTASLQEVDCVTVNLALAGSRHYTKRGRVADVWYYLLLVQHYIILDLMLTPHRQEKPVLLYSHQRVW